MEREARRQIRSDLVQPAVGVGEHVVGGRHVHLKRAAEAPELLFTAHLVRLRNGGADRIRRGCIDREHRVAQIHHPSGPGALGAEHEGDGDLGGDSHQSAVGLHIRAEDAVVPGVLGEEEAECRHGALHAARGRSRAPSTGLGADCVQEGLSGAPGVQAVGGRKVNAPSRPLAQHDQLLCDLHRTADLDEGLAVTEQHLAGRGRRIHTGDGADEGLRGRPPSDSGRLELLRPFCSRHAAARLCGEHAPGFSQVARRKRVRVGERCLSDLGGQRVGSDLRRACGSPHRAESHRSDAENGHGSGDHRHTSCGLCAPTGPKRPRASLCKRPAWGRRAGHAYCPSACRAAACSACFLLFPVPRPSTLPPTRTSVTKVRSWSGPDCDTTR